MTLQLSCNASSGNPSIQRLMNNHKEAPGQWLGVSDTVGDAMTFHIHSEKSKRVIQRSVMKPAKPEDDGFPNHRIVWDEEESSHNKEITIATEMSPLLLHQNPQK